MQRDRSGSAPRPSRPTSAKEWTDLVRQAEDLGYASFQMDDHFGNQLAIVPALMAAADATSKILVGPHVAGVDFRNPVLFAKECATIDLLSEGRFTLGIGAGWSDEGLRHRRHPPGRRLDPHRAAGRGRARS